MNHGHHNKLNKNNEKQTMKDVLKMDDGDHGTI